MIPKIFSTLILCLLFFSSQAQSIDSLPHKLDELVTAYEQVYGFSGTVKVVLDENPVFEHSYGFADRSFSVKNTPETHFSWMTNCWWRKGKASWASLIPMSWSSNSMEAR